MSIIFMAVNEELGSAFRNSFFSWGERVGGGGGGGG